MKKIFTLFAAVALTASALWNTTKMAFGLSATMTPTTLGWNLATRMANSCSHTSSVVKARHGVATIGTVSAQLSVVISPTMDSQALAMDGQLNTVAAWQVVAASSTRMAQ